MKFTDKILEQIVPQQLMQLAEDYDYQSVGHLEDFYNKNRHIERSVLNAVLLVALQSKDGFIPNKVYLDKTLKTWQKRNYMTARKSATRLNELSAWKNKDETGKTKKPEWLDEYMKEIELMDN